MDAHDRVGYELTRQDIQQLALSIQGVADLKSDVAEIKRMLNEDKRNCGDCKQEIFTELNTIKTQHAEERGAITARTNMGVVASSFMGLVAVIFSIWNSLRNGA